MLWYLFFQTYFIVSRIFPFIVWLHSNRSAKAHFERVFDENNLIDWVAAHRKEIGVCASMLVTQRHLLSFTHSASAHTLEAGEVIAQKYLHAALSALFVYQGGAIAGDFATRCQKESAHTLRDGNLFWFPRAWVTSFSCRAERKQRFSVQAGLQYTRVTQHNCKKCILTQKLVILTPNLNSAQSTLSKSIPMKPKFQWPKSSDLSGSPAQVEFSHDRRPAVFSVYNQDLGPWTRILLHPSQISTSEWKFISCMPNLSSATIGSGVNILAAYDANKNHAGCRGRGTLM